MTVAGDIPALPPDVDRQLEGAPPAEIAVSLPTYNNAATVSAVTDAIRGGLEKHFAGVPAVLISADAGSSDATVERLAAAGLILVRAAHEAPLAERASVPFHGVPGRGAALRLAFAVAERLGARGLVVLEADVTSIRDVWVERLLRPVLDEGVDLVLPVYERHRYDGTITNLVLAPLVGALYGRRLRQPLAGARGFSGRLVKRLVGDPGWPPAGRRMTDLWIEGLAIAEGVTIREALLGQWRVESSTRSGDLPAMVAETLGAVFTLMDDYEPLWRDAPGADGEAVAGPPALPSAEPMRIDVARMIAAFRRGLRDLGSIWEHVLAPETLGDVLSLTTDDPDAFRFPDHLWARVVYDFALGHHYHVVYRDHLLRSFVPLYLGRTAAFVIATVRDDAAATAAALDAVGAAFEQEKPYLVDSWR